MIDRSERKQQMTIRLYEKMPGAPMPTKVRGVYMWANVEGNDQWVFCEAIADAMLDVRDDALRAIGQTAADHNLI